MTDALYREHPKNRYLEASLLDKIMTYSIQFLPTTLTDRLRLSFQSQLINLYR
jgi:3-hydroxybutyrate dehydrogenase